MKRRLLIADADRAMAGLYNAYFSKAGYSVETVSDSLACVSRLRRDLPDLLLLDQALPGGGGDEVLACLREECALTRIPVVVMTDLIPIHSLSRLTTPPVIRYLGKRCPFVTLRYCIDSALASALRRPQAAGPRTSMSVKLNRSPAGLAAR
jgi:CheY-like chemotaxis protein